MKLGNYIVIEGADGAGKSKLAKSLSSHLKANYTFEPYRGDSDTPVLNEIYKICCSKDGYPDLTMDAREMLLLTGRTISQERIVKPLLKRGETVVTDRSYISGMVYASMEGMSHADWLKRADFIDVLIPPDLLILVVNPDCQPRGSVNDRYDNNGKEFSVDVELEFVNCIDYLLHHLDWGSTTIVVFENDFTKTPDENFNRLLEELEARRLIG